MKKLCTLAILLIAIIFQGFGQEINSANNVVARQSLTVGNNKVTEIKKDSIGMNTATALTTGKAVYDFVSGRISSISDVFDGSEDQPYGYNFIGKDSISLFTKSTDGTLTFTQDTTGIQILRTTPATSFHINYLMLKQLGQVWANRWSQQMEFKINVYPSANTWDIGLGIKGLGDNELSTSLGETTVCFAVVAEFGATASTSGIRIKCSTEFLNGNNNNYTKTFFTGFVWKQGDVIRLNVFQQDNNSFVMKLQNVTTGKTLSGVIRNPLPNPYESNINYASEPGYFSILTNGGNFTVSKYKVDYPEKNATLVVVGNSITFGYGTRNDTKSNAQYTWYNLVKDSLPYRSVLMAKGGTTTNDVLHILPEIIAHKPKYVALDGLMTNDYFVGDIEASKLKYANIVRQLKKYGIKVIHITPCPRGVTDASYGGFQLNARNYIIQTYPNDIVINSFNNLLAPSTTSSLNGSYFTGGDGTHLNVLGHSVRAADILPTLKNLPTAEHFDRAAIDSAYFNTGANEILYSDANGKASGDPAFIYQGGNVSAAVQMTASSNRGSHLRWKNLDPGNNAAAGVYLENNIGHLFQILIGSSGYSYTPDGIIMGSTGAANFKIANYAGPVDIGSNYGVNVGVTARFTNDGKMGVNELNPTTKFHLTGTNAFRYVDGNQDTKRVLMSDATGYGYWGVKLSSGTYSPTVTNILDATVSSASVAQYMRVDSVVTVSGQFTITSATSHNQKCTIELTLPIASTFTQSYQLSGSAKAKGATDNSYEPQVYGSTSSGKMRIDAFPTDVPQTYIYTATYLIL